MRACLVLHKATGRVLSKCQTFPYLPRSIASLLIQMADLESDAKPTFLIFPSTFSTATNTLCVYPSVSRGDHDKSPSRLYPRFQLILPCCPGFMMSLMCTLLRKLIRADTYLDVQDGGCCSCRIASCQQRYL